MAVSEKNEYCAFHYENPSDGECSNCGLSICEADTEYDASANRLCQLCFNITRAKPILRYIQIGLWGIVIASVIVLWSILGSQGIWYALIPVVLILFAPYFLRPLIMRLYFRDLTPGESILPILRYFEASGNLDHYKMFIKFIKQIDKEELEKIQQPLYQYLVPALAFNFSKLPENWESEVTDHLKITRKEFITLLTQDYRAILIQTAVHNAQANMSMFMYYLSEDANDPDLLKEYIKEIVSSDVMKLDEESLNTIYKNLLEDLYLYEDKFYDTCDELGLSKEKLLLKQLIDRFEPPLVPKNQIEAVLSPEQLKEKRKREKEQAEQPEQPEQLQFVTNEEESQ